MGVDELDSDLEELFGGPCPNCADTVRLNLLEEILLKADTWREAGVRLADLMTTDDIMYSTLREALDVVIAKQLEERTQNDSK